jgi:hypothetical protein
MNPTYKFEYRSERIIVIYDQENKLYAFFDRLKVIDVTYNGGYTIITLDYNAKISLYGNYLSEILDLVVFKDSIKD